MLSLLILALAWGIYKRSRRVLAAAAVLLFLWSWDPAAALVAYSLERWYPIRQLPVGDAEAIVVLSGGAYHRDAGLPEDLPKADTYLRTSYASWLYRNWRALPIVATGGPSGKRHPVALGEVERRVLEEKGVPAAMIWVENRSRSTYENALYSAELLRAKGIRRIALVTEAHHMLRSELAFRRQGLVVVPAPCAYRGIRFGGEPAEFIPNAGAIDQNELCLHEWLGLLWYRLTGKA